MCCMSVVGLLYYTYRVFQWNMDRMRAIYIPM